MSSGYKSSQDVQAMFGRIAPRYDLMNRLMTFGQDLRWRRFLVKRLALSSNATVLDMASGTGDIAFEIRNQYPQAEIIAADFALPMMQVGKRRPTGEKVFWLGADGMKMPFSDDKFDAIVSGYLFRNVPNIETTLSEQFRSLKAGGMMATLDSSPPKDNILKPFITMHLKYIIPMLGQIITPDPDAYAYLPASTMRYKTPQEFVALMEQAGFINVGYQEFMFGTMAVHWGQKPR